MTSRDKKQVTVVRSVVGLGALFLFIFVGSYLDVPGFSSVSYIGSVISYGPTTTPETLEIISQVVHVPTPSAVKGVYMTSCVASMPSLRNKLVNLINETELNSVVIDIKSFDGYISFEPQHERVRRAMGGCFVPDMKEFIEELHSHNIYVIGRVASFQDALQVKLHPEYAVKMQSATSTVWRDHKGIPWIDASAKPQWEYLVLVAKEAYNIGFDEINFDYIRFPSDGNMKDIYYPWSGTQKKSEVMRSFFKYLHDELSPTGMVLSADLFGMTTTNTDDLNIGQVLEYALPYFDYIAPMVYPSHYPPSFLGLGDPNKHVYTVVNYSMKEAVRRTIATTTRVYIPDGRIGTSTPAIYAKPSFDRNKLRPWLQDNNYPVPYTAEMVRDQIRATYDTGLNSWMLWNAGNRYTRAALESEVLVELE